MYGENHYVYLMGGLGNQLFIYAFARLLSEAGKKVYLVAASFGRDNLRNYKLHQYNVRIPIVRGMESYISDKRIRLGIKGILSQNVYVAPNSFEYIDEEVIDKYQYFYGYFQNSKFVDPYIRKIRHELQYTGCFSDIQEKVVGEISGCESVGVHIRRGDYLKNVSIFRIIGGKYYLDAMQYARKKLRNPQFFIFSDDIGWCKGIFSGLDDVHFIDEAYQNTDVIDFEILRCCKHFIIGNSTFSWWASKLSEAEPKLLIAPGEWFESADLNLHSRKKLLSGYILI